MSIEHNSLMTVQEACDALMVGKNTIYDLIRSNKIDAFPFILEPSFSTFFTLTDVIFILTCTPFKLYLTLNTFYNISKINASII